MADSVPEPAPHHTKIKDWPAAERPREKLLARGAHALSDAELVAILIRVGSRKSTALDLARKILVEEKNLRGIAGKTPQELMRLKGIGEAKAVELLAAFEIGRRVQGQNGEEKIVLTTPEQVAQRMIPRLRETKHESFWVLLLDTRNCLMHEQELTIGTLNASLVHPREVFKVAIDRVAASVIAVHNHPSGIAEPSQEDLNVTRQLVDAGRIIGIPLHDHVIVAGDSYMSFAERGML
jgi:DNA repair protein RadC